MKNCFHFKIYRVIKKKLQNLSNIFDYENYHQKIYLAFNLNFKKKTLQNKKGRAIKFYISFTHYIKVSNFN